MLDGRICREKVRVVCESRCFHNGKWIRKADLPKGAIETHTQWVDDYWIADRIGKNLLNEGVDYCWVMLDNEYSWGKRTERLCYTR